MTPDKDVTLFLHCHIPAHDKVGMMGKLIVGKGGEPKAISRTPKTYPGIGTVVGTIPRSGRLVVSHEDIPGFMAAMEMSFAVNPPSLLNGLNPGDKINFTFDEAKTAITTIQVIERMR